MGELRVIGNSSSVMDGDRLDVDLRLTWSKDNAEQTALVEKTFIKYVNEGWLAFSEASGEKKLIFTFDSDLEKITLVPIIEGG